MVMERRDNVAGDALQNILKTINGGLTVGIDNTLGKLYTTNVKGEYFSSVTTVILTRKQRPSVEVMHWL